MFLSVVQSVTGSGLRLTGSTMVVGATPEIVAAARAAAKADAVVTASAAKNIGNGTTGS